MTRRPAFGTTAEGWTSLVLQHEGVLGPEGFRLSALGFVVERVPRLSRRERASERGVEDGGAAVFTRAGDDGEQAGGAVRPIDRAREALSPAAPAHGDVGVGDGRVAHDGAVEPAVERGQALGDLDRLDKETLARSEEVEEEGHVLGGEPVVQVGESVDLHAPKTRGRDRFLTPGSFFSSWRSRRRRFAPPLGSTT